jgi:hypothetical protein
MKTRAYVIHPDGTGLKWQPTFEPGDPGTREFAEASRAATTRGGISIVLGADVTHAAVEKLEDLLDALDAGTLP